MLLCIGLTVTVWYASERDVNHFAVCELMARVCSRMFLCVYDPERSGCPRPSVASIISYFTVDPSRSPSPDSLHIRYRFQTRFWWEKSEI